MRFEVSERIRTSRSREQILASLQEQFQKVAMGVAREGEVVVVRSIEATFGSINRSDTTAITVRDAEGGFLVVADVHYRPSVAFWIILPITCCSTFVWILPIGFYLYQRKTVRTAIAECFERVRNEHATAGTPASGTPDSPITASPPSLHTPLAASATEPAKQENQTVSAPPPLPPTQGVVEPSPAQPPSSDWYYAKDGQRLGPIAEAEVVAMLSRQELSRETMVWQSGWPDWLPLQQTALARHLSGPPPLVGEAVGNVWVWLLAFAPALGEFLAGFVSALFSIPLGYLWWITLLLNVGLSTLDERKLRLAGHDTSRMGAAWIVPVYLFKRARVLRQNNAYFIVWCVLFALLLFGVL